VIWPKSNSQDENLMAGRRQKPLTVQKSGDEQVDENDRNRVY
jgi:hypothetical protein